MADQRCKRCGEMEPHMNHHGMREEFGGHPFEPEDAAPAPKTCPIPTSCDHAEMCLKDCDEGFIMDGFQQTPGKPGYDPTFGGRLKKTVTRLIDKTDEWEARQAEKGDDAVDEFVIGMFCPSILECSNVGKCLQDCHNKPQPAIVPTPLPVRDEAGARLAGACEGLPKCQLDPIECGRANRCLKNLPVAQPGAVGEPCAVCGRDKSQHRPYVRPRADKPLGLEPTGWICPEPPFSSAIRCFKPAKPAADQVDAEQWPQCAAAHSHNEYMDVGGLWREKAMLAYAAHVTKGIEAELAKSQKYGRTEYGIEQLLRKDLDAAEARNVELMGERKEIVPQRNKWMMLCSHFGLQGESTCVATISDRLEAAESQLAEAQKALEDMAEFVHGNRMIGPSPIGPLHACGWNEAIAHVVKRVKERAALRPSGEEEEKS